MTRVYLACNLTPAGNDAESQVDAEAVAVIVAHQRLDVGSCVCGWGVDTGDLGRSHSQHVWRALRERLDMDVLGFSR